MNSGSRCRAYTLVEMLTTIAVLVVVMGLMVSLARNVRAQTAQTVTQNVLLRLDELMRQYQENNGGQLPAIAPLIPSDAAAPPDEATLRRAAMINNAQFVQVLLNRRTVAREFAGLPNRLYDRGKPRLDDEWGNPIVFMASGNMYIGTAPYGRPFFFSAGRDGKYLTLYDNLNSYDLAAENSQQDRSLPDPPQPVRPGQSE